MSKESTAVTKYPGIENILRRVPDEQAFYFYKGLDEPLGPKAGSLEEFLELAKSVDASSLEFHLNRNDFQNWVSMLGDATLAKQISSLKTKNLKPAELKNQLVKIVRMRLGRLKKLKEIYS